MKWVGRKKCAAPDARHAMPGALGAIIQEVKQRPVHCSLRARALGAY